MEVAYAINERIGGAGIGTPAYYACSAMKEKGYLKQALALGYQKIGKTDFRNLVDVPVPLGKTFSNIMFGMRRIIPRFPAYTFRDNLFDILAERKLKPCDVFHGWNHHCLRMLRKAKRWNAATIVERGSTHIDFQNTMLQREYRKYGVRFKPIERAVVKRCKAEFAEADYLLVNSEFSRDTFIDAGVKREKMVCIPRGIDLKRFSVERRRDSWPAKFTVLYVGLLSLRKGIPYLLEAWNRLRLDDARLVLVGNALPDAIRLLARYRRNPSITYRGFVPDIRSTYRDASLFVFPSIEEGSAKVTFEAMAAGLPVITTPNSGSAVRNKKDGYVVPICDAGALADKIQKLKDDESLRRKLGRHAQRQVQRFSVENYKRALIRFYETLG